MFVRAFRHSKSFLFPPPPYVFVTSRNNQSGPILRIVKRHAIYFIPPYVPSVPPPLDLPMGFTCDKRNRTSCLQQFLMRRPLRTHARFLCALTRLAANRTKNRNRNGISHPLNVTLCATLRGGGFTPARGKRVSSEEIHRCDHLGATTFATFVPLLLAWLLPTPESQGSYIMYVNRGCESHKRSRT